MPAIDVITKGASKDKSAVQAISPRLQMPNSEYLLDSFPTILKCIFRFCGISARRCDLGAICGIVRKNVATKSLVAIGQILRQRMYFLFRAYCPLVSLSIKGIKCVIRT